VRQHGNLLNYPRAGRRAPWRWLPSLRLLVVGFVLAVVGVLAAAVLAYVAVDVPAREAEGVNYQTSSVYFSDGQTKMADFSKDGVNRVPLPEGPEGEPQVPANVANAIIAAEDRTFRENRGISVTGLARAVYGVVTGKDLGGGSTITQQYVKNIYGDDAPTYARKAREAVIALKLDQQRTKDEILARYLDTIYYGRGAYGIETAADVYFRTTAAELSVSQAALLVGIVPAPSAWDPANDPERAQERYDYVINSMVETGALTAAEAAANPDMPPTEPLRTSQTYAGPTGHVLMAVRQELETYFSEEEIDTGGLRIQTTIDPRLQQAAVDAMRDPEVYPTEGRPPTVQSGLVSIDPASGAVRAMYGGDDYLARQRNSVTQDTAQAGSTFKPFTLVAALEAGWSLRDTLGGDSPRTFRAYVDGDGDPVPVSNFGGSDSGSVDLVEATANSVNTAYVELNLDVGPEATKEVAERAGLPDDQEAADLGLEPIPAVPSNVLGTATVRPIDMAEAFATFAAKGLHHEPHLVTQVTRSADAEVLYTVDPRAEQVFDAGVMADATVAMQAVVEDGSAERYASRLDRPAAGKTGTTQANRAAWFSGYTPQLATTVVLFNVADGTDPAVPANTQLELPGFGGRDETTGGSWPSAIWTRYMQTALDDVDAPVIEFPEGTRQRRSTPSASSSSTTPSETPSASPSEEAPPSEEPSETPSAEPTASEPSEEGDGEGQGEGDGGEEPVEGESEPAPEDQAAAGNGRGNGGGGGNGGGNRG
jgi:membrane peptidoglycan carboxypeptidase